MNRLLKITILSIAVAATTLTALIPADAHDRWRHGRHSDGGDLVAAGVLGLAVGAIAAGVLADDPPYRPVYDEPIYRDPLPRPRPHRPYYVEPEPSVVYYQDQAALEPWSPEWFRYCGDRYRSFDPDTGTFTGYDGEAHFCVAN
jgi:BA14K-like protein